MTVIHTVKFQSVSRHLLTSYKPLMKNYRILCPSVNTFSTDLLILLYSHIICCDFINFIEVNIEGVFCVSVWYVVEDLAVGNPMKYSLTV